ncbi:hypothetical protein ASF61_06580 [Duganella sp. Leaf126]|uniref:hypothetical protein n=1 Tax=Duganella sp. Leaf126 TaxID=1736266 RepID=UPI0006F3CE65|nr:hypothetical protein [Duganella sp. Leaf126]KQQ40416.1 hypothetical protein ASF61_06580 [Duganella sp. Leaf126]
MSANTETELAAVKISLASAEQQLAERDKRVAQLHAQVGNWHKACRGLQDLVNDIGLLLGGDLPRQQVTQVARERMERIAALERRIHSDAKIMHDVLVGNQAAWIEWRRGAGAEAAMTWVQNSLMGVGVPDEAAPWASEPQAWYSANKADPFPTCFCGRPSNTLWMGRGFCSDAHYEQGRAKADADAAGKTGLPLFDGTSPDTEGGSCD